MEKRTFEGLEVLHGHAQHSEFVELAGHGVTRGNHGRQLVDQVVHLVPPPFLNLAVWFPKERQLVYYQNEFYMHLRHA